MKHVLENCKASWSKFAMAWTAVIWFYLTLYLSGVVTTQQGLLIFLAALFSCVMATVLTPGLEVRRAAEPEPDSGRVPQAPRFGRYLMWALGLFLAVWGYLYAVEQAAAWIGTQPRWPVASVKHAGIIALAAFALMGLLAILHQRAWRNAQLNR